MRELIKGLKVLFLTLFTYLFQACAMKYFAFNGVTANLAFITLAVFVVSLGKKYAFCGSCIIGIFMECMLSNVPAMYVIAYPVITMICAQLFADMSDRQRERRIADNQGKNVFSRLRRKELPALMRIPLCAALMDGIWHTVMCVYMYLIGVDIAFSHIARAITAILYTTGLAVLLMLPMRYFLGMYRRPKKRRRQDAEDDELPFRGKKHQPADDGDEEEAPLELSDDYNIYPEEGE